MADDYIQSDSPLIDTPEVLDAEAMAPASDAEILAALSRPPPEPQVRRPPGRPKGSKNKPRDPNEPPRQRQRMVTPAGQVKPLLTPEDIERKARKKKLRADELTRKITTELNDNIMTLITMMGVPPQALFKDGMAKQAVVVNPNYTDIANALAIQPSTASVWGKFLAELEATDTGSKVSALSTGGNIPLFAYGLMSLALGWQYAQTVSSVMGNVRQMADAHKEYLRQQAEQEAAQAAYDQQQAEQTGAA